METLVYTPPPTVKHFIKSHRKGKLFYDWIVGPVGSGKTTGLFFKLAYMAKLQEPGPDGIRRSRAVVVRSTNPQLKDTTIKSWETWFKPGQAGTWELTDRTFTLRFADVECEVLFRPLDTPQDVSRVLSLEITFAIIDEFVDIPRAIVDALAGRLGRYPSRKEGGATNWGMWGSSNPGTEDNWWHDYLHDEKEVQRVELFGGRSVQSNIVLGQSRDATIRYFHQPAGDSQWAENLDNLPGGQDYYVDLKTNRSDTWINQFIRAMWGFSASETPVVKTFNIGLHVKETRLEFNPWLPLVVGFDPGLGGTAAIFGQEDVHGRLSVLSELGSVGVGVRRFVSDKMMPHIRQLYPKAEVIIAPDPAAGNKTQVDEVAVVAELRRHFQVSIETNNQLSKRLDAIETYTTRLTEMGPALLIDKERCPILTRALAGGWRFGIVPKGEHIRPAPEKNSFSHYGDAFGYLCRYYDKSYDRSKMRGVTVLERRNRARQVAPQQSNSYNVS